jgi:hypothetical protein
MVQKFECGADYTATVILGTAVDSISVPIVDHAAQLSLSLPPSPRQFQPSTLVMESQAHPHGGSP